MTNKELLERCAKVMGLNLLYWNDGTEPYSSGEGYILDGNRIWNPLTNLADAADMAIKCKVDVMWTNVPAGNQAVTVFQGQQKPITAYFKDHPTEQAAYCYAVCSVVAQVGGE